MLFEWLSNLMVSHYKDSTLATSDPNAEPILHTFRRKTALQADV